MLKLVLLVFTLLSAAPALAITADEFMNESIRRCRADLVTEALAAGASPNYRDPASGTTPLMVAYATGCDEGDIYLSLIKAGADINAQDNFGTTALHIAVQRKPKFGCFLKTSGLLIDAKANPNLANRDGETPIFRAIANFSLYCSNEPLIGRLIRDAKADLNLVNNAGLSVLEYAVETLGADHGAAILMNLVRGGAQTTDRILYKLISPLATNQNGFRNLIYVVQEMFKTNITVTGFTDADGRNALHLGALLAVNERQYDSMLNPHLVALTPLLAVQDKDGNSPLHLYLTTIRNIARLGKLQADMVRAYVATKTNVNLRNAKGQTALKLAKEIGYYEIIWIIQQAGGVE